MTTKCPLAAHRGQWTEAWVWLWGDVPLCAVPLASGPGEPVQPLRLDTNRSLDLVCNSPRGPLGRNSQD